MPEIEFVKLPSNLDPRSVLEKDFPSYSGALPIKGGWGYSLEDACVIDRNDPVVNQDLPFDGVGLEYLFAQLRLYEELIVVRSGDDRYSGVEHVLNRQAMMTVEGRRYDHLVFDVTALSDPDFEALKAEWEGPEGIVNPNFDRAAHIRRRDALIRHGVAEFWFDITSFYGA